MCYDRHPFLNLLFHPEVLDIDIKHFWIKEQVEKGVAIVTHLGTADTFANILTKPLARAQFNNEREMLMG